ncbi:MAG: C25 family cysteine peptidase [Gemmataceae bacterium]
MARRSEVNTMRGATWRIPLLLVLLAARPLPAAERVVYLAGRLSDEEHIVLSAGAAADGDPVLLLDTPATAAHLKAFFTAYRPTRVVPIGEFADSPAEREARLGVSLEPAATLDTLARKLGRVVVCPAEPRDQLLNAAWFAGVAKAALIVTGDSDELANKLRDRLAALQARELFAVGAATKSVPRIDGVKTTELADGPAVAAAALRLQAATGPVETLVVANPADGRLSRLAPWIAVQKRAALLLTNAAGDNTAAVVRTALQNPDLRRTDYLLLVADLKAIPLEKRPNPAAGKDTEIVMEPLTPQGEEPFTFATGRLFHADPGVVALVLARQRLLAEAKGPHRAVVASNPGGGLPMLETFSRQTARELKNGGYDVSALFEDDIDGPKLRGLLPEADVFLWEGHYKTLVEEFQMPKWNEPLRPSLVFLQSCLALNEAEAQPLLQRGAVALVGSATRNYSATGGSFSLAFFDAMLYDNRTLGGSLRQAKNFLVAYTLLKEKRLGESAKLSGANIRSAWAFSLWGDPTLKLPQPERPANGMSIARAEVTGNTIILSRPEESYPEVKKEKYTARTLPNGRMAGLLTKGMEEESRVFVPFLFAEVKLTPRAAGKVPHLKTKVSERSWVFVWDSRRNSGYLLMIPPTKAKPNTPFDVAWEDQ